MSGEATRFGPGNQAAVTHAATAESRIRPVARLHRRRLMRQLGLRAREMDPLAKGYLDLYVRTQSKVALADEYLAEHGLLDAEGKPRPVLSVYTSWVNSSRLALSRLEAHLGTREANPAEALAEAGRKVREGDAEPGAERALADPGCGVEARPCTCERGVACRQAEGGAAALADPDARRDGRGREGVRRAHRRGQERPRPRQTARLRGCSS